MAGTCLFATVLVVTGVSSYAEADGGGGYHVVTTVTGSNVPPSGQWCVDISWYDSHNNRYYLADDNNRQVDVVDAATNQLLTPIGTGDFTGIAGCASFDFSQEGPEGIVTDDMGQLWVGNGDSTVHVYNANSGARIATVSTGGTKRADEFAYDPADKLILVTNPDDAQPFVTAINAVTHAIVPNGQFQVPGAQSLEQPLWNPVDGLFYMSIPSTNSLPGGEIAVIDPTKLPQPVVKTFPDSDCGPSGLALDVQQQLLMLGCSTAAEVMNARSGHIVTRVPQITGTDEVWFNPGDQRYYLGSFGIPALGVVDGQSNQFITNVPTAPGFHAAAASSQNNEVFVPETGLGIVVLKASHK